MAALTLLDEKQALRTEYTFQDCGDFLPHDDEWVESR